MSRRDSNPLSGGRYRLIRKLGSGGMAEAWLAHSEGALGGMRSLVVKRLHAHLGMRAEVVQLFKSEARLAVMMSHPNVVETVEVGQSPEGLFLVMEYVDGLSLRELLRALRGAREQLSPPLAARLVADACAAMAYVHGLVDPATGTAMGVVHRDLSPDNLMLSRAGVLKVLDFGVARARGQLHRTEPGRVRGKLEYMAPEQLMGQEVDARTDIYALGAVLYELLAGVRPFGGHSDAARVQSLLEADPVSLRERRPDVPPGLAAVVERAMARLPAERYAGCAQMQNELEAWLLQGGIPSGRPQLAALAQRWGSAVDAQAPATPAQRRAQPPAELTPTEVVSRSELAPGITVRFRGAPRGRQDHISTVTLQAQPRRRPLSRAGKAGAALAALAAAVGGGAWLARLVPEHGASAGGAFPAVAGAPATQLPEMAPGGPAHALEQDAEVPRGPTPPAPGVPPEPMAASASRRVPVAPGPARGIRDEAGAPVAPLPARAPRAGMQVPAVPSAVDRFSVSFRVTPWATLYVDGELLGDTPMAPVQLAAGAHRVRLVNPEIAVDRELSLQVGPGLANALRVQLDTPVP